MEALRHSRKWTVVNRYNYNSHVINACVLQGSVLVHTSFLYTVLHHFHIQSYANDCILHTVSSMQANLSVGLCLFNLASSYSISKNMAFKQLSFFHHHQKHRIIHFVSRTSRLWNFLHKEKYVLPSMLTFRRYKREIDHY